MKHKMKFVEMVPDLAEGEYQQRNIPPELCDFTVKLALNRKLTMGATQKIVYNNLLTYIGPDFLQPEVIRIAASLAIMCRQMADGRNKKTVSNYLNYRILVASYIADYYGGYYGDWLLTLLSGDVDTDAEGSKCPAFPPAIRSLRKLK